MWPWKKSIKQMNGRNLLSGILTKIGQVGEYRTSQENLMTELRLDVFVRNVVWDVS